MHFKIDPPGSDYTRVQLDVPNGQLEEIIRAVTTAGHTASETPSWREWETKRRPRPTNRPEATRDERPIWRNARAVTRPVPRWLWDLLTEDARAESDPRCFVCGRHVSFRQYKAASGAICAVDPATRAVQIACRGCVAEQRAQTVVSALRPVTAESVLGGELVGVRLPAAGGEVQVMLVGESDAHVVLAPIASRAGGVASEGGRGHVARVDPEHLGVTVIGPVLKPEADTRGGAPNAGKAEKETDVRVRVSVESDLDQAGADGDGQGDRVAGHGVSLDACRCAGAARPDGAGDAEPTKVEALLEEAVELLKALGAAQVPQVTVRPDCDLAGYLDSLYGGSDCEGPEGGESA